MSSRTYTEDEVQDLTDRVFLLREQLEAGKMRFANQELADGFRRSYEAIRLRRWQGRSDVLGWSYPGNDACDHCDEAT